MPEMNLGKWLIVAGIALVALGLLVMAGSKLGLGRLPGDIRYESGSTRVYFPITTMILLSVVLTLLIWLIHWWRR